jgi:multidrug efflux pump
MEELKTELPRRHRLPNRLRHDAVHSRVGQRGVQDAARRDHPRGDRRAVLPARLEGDDLADDRRAGVAGRHVRGDGGDGLQLNNLTLFGLVLAIGIVVDDAIVVLENVERQMATGLDPKTATIKAMDEITGPIVTITLVLSSVFIAERIHAEHLTGQFYRQFALTIAAAMVISAMNAMTLTPARAASVFSTEHVDEHGGHEHVREALPWWSFAFFGAVLTYWLGQEAFARQLCEWLAPGKNYATWMPQAVFYSLFLPVLVAGGAAGWFVIRPVNRILAIVFQAFNRVFDLITTAYGFTVARLVRLSFVVLVVYGGLLYATYHTFTTAPTSFIPMQDQGYLLVNVQLPDSASLQRSDEVMHQLERILLGDESQRYKGRRAKQPGEKKYEGVEGVAHTVSVAGQSFLLGSNGSNFGSCFVILDGFDERRDHELYDEIIASKIQKLVAMEIEDAIVSVFRAPPIQGLGNAGGFKFQVEQRGFVDLVALQKATDEIVLIGNTPPQKRDPAEPGPRKLAGLFTMFRAETPQLYIDVDRTKCQSLHVNVDDVFNTLQVYMGGAYVNLFNRFGRTWQVNVMADSQFRTESDYLAQLKVRNKEGEMVPLGTLASVRDAGGPVMVMRYNMYNSASVNGAALPGVSSGEAIAEIEKLCKDNGVPFEWTEITYLQIKAGNVAILVFGLGTLLVYLVLAAKYESWSLPLSVILVVPMCLLCAIVGMLIARLPVDIFVQIGFLVLVGLAAKNAVLIVEFAEQLRREGKPMLEAIVESCKLRFRPIVMTSFAFILGVVPLMLGHGAGAEMRRSLGTAVFSGMIGVTIFGVLLTPVFYYSIMWLAERRKSPPTSPGPTPPTPPSPPASNRPAKKHA